MSSIRERVRTSLPFSTDIYEFVVSSRKMRPTPKKVRALLVSGQPVMLDIGGADKGKDGWTTLDITETCDLYWDLRKGIPFPDKSVHAIYSSHLLEHLTYQQGQTVLAESIRVLKPGGTFSICVPNARIYIEGYLGMREIPEDYFGWKPAFNSTTAIDAVNYVAYMDGEHKYMFDIDNLLHLLNEAGFVDVRERSLDASVDRPERDFESIYAIGTKR
jgi:predicted SAM-dependent methyltransferase